MFVDEPAEIIRAIVIFQLGLALAMAFGEITLYLQWFRMNGRVRLIAMALQRLALSIGILAVSIELVTRFNDPSLTFRTVVAQALAVTAILSMYLLLRDDYRVDDHERRRQSR